MVKYRSARAPQFASLRAQAPADGAFLPLSRAQQPGAGEPRQVCVSTPCPARVRRSPGAAPARAACKAKGAYLRTHFKQCREVAGAVRGMFLPKAIRYLEDVLERKQAVPFLRFTGGIGRHAQGHMRKAPGDKVAWPQKSTKFILDLLRNAEANAEAKGLDVATLRVTHILANRAPKTRRRTYRAHGRIGPYQSSPAHIELFCTADAEPVAKAEEVKPRKLTRKQLAQRRLKLGGGVAQE